MSLREKVIVGYKGEIGSALVSILKAEYGIEKEGGRWLKRTVKYRPLKDHFLKYQEDPLYMIPKGLIVHICIPYSKQFEEIVMNYIDKLEPKIVIIHTSCAPGTTKKINEQTKVPVVHVPINGRHPNMESDIRKYVMFVGCDSEEDGQFVCDYLNYYGIDTYLCSSPTLTEIAKLSSTEFLRVQIKFFQRMKTVCKEFNVNWAEFIEFFKAINYKTFQRAGKIDTPVSGKHCLNNNHKILVDAKIVAEDEKHSP